MTEPAIMFENVRAPMLGGDLWLELDLRIMAGEFVACVGPGRAGKSLMVELAAGLVAPESGRVLVLGKDWSEVADEDTKSVRLRVGVVLQQPGLLSNMTLFNNVLLPLRYHRGGMSDRHREQAVMGQLERLGLAALRDRFPAELNQGEARRGAIARAMMLAPEVLLLDDPVAGLDADMVLGLKGYVEEWRAHHPLTVLAVLRAWSPFVEAVDRVVVLREGRVQADGTRDGVRELVPAALKRYVE
ncbi:MAG: ATP-binding cassette domain-containing protein [Nitrospira sp. CR1.1]|jgi:ABC-type transporter Mla maintaining outer membrane lipid asymmetry ATPase subunit MlaF|nr:ATP-binding cassette domain-containing protein [Nitrospira sp. CR1.1]